MSVWSLPLLLPLLLTVSYKQSADEDALCDGRALRWSMRGLVGFKREAVRLKAVRCYRSGVYSKESDASDAQCACQAGELLELGGLSIAAIRDLSLGAELDAGEWGVRCALKLGELYLDEERAVEALLVFSEAAKSRAPTCLLERAMVSAGRALEVMGESALAVQTWRGVAQDGRSSIPRLDAFECWGKHLLMKGDLEGAAGVLEHCRVALEVDAQEMTAAGAVLRARLISSSFARSIRLETLCRYRKMR